MNSPYLAPVDLSRLRKAADKKAAVRVRLWLQVIHCGVQWGVLRLQVIHCG